MDPLIERGIVEAGATMGRTIRLLYDGVAFRQDGQTFNVFSHEGDELGQVSTGDLTYVIGFMKRLGRRVGKCTHPTFDVNKNGAVEPGFSFAWIDWLVINGHRM